MLVIVLLVIFNACGGSDNYPFKKTRHYQVAIIGTGSAGLMTKDDGAIASKNRVNTVVGFTPITPLLVVFSHTNICFAGKYFNELEKEKVDFVVGESAFTSSGRVLIKSEQGGIIRISVDRVSGILLGSEMMGVHTEHLIAWVIDQKLTVNQVLSFPFYHPSLEETLRSALRDAKSKMGISVNDLELFRVQIDGKLKS